MTRTATVAIATGLALLVPGAAAAQPGGGTLPQGKDPVSLNPADFTTRIDNPYWPMPPGRRWVYSETDFDKRGKKLRTVVAVTNRTWVIAGVRTRLVRSVETENGAVVERASDWYAQDGQGNVWYLGERTTEYERGKVVSTDERWQTGRRGAQAGVVMPANPTPGMHYRQEYNPGQSEDSTTVFSLDEQVELPFRHAADVVMTKETDLLTPRELEYKFYVRDVGPALMLLVSDGREHQELVRFERGRR